ncbi:unnamed protein product [Phyllotreta striolata]|uniref:UDP-glucuronosyltransferase n=1 Tax=Phyllotreta striolata TaxID=444603 RepID=A0A9N9XKN1_PHYSR|nr:unnamed protein product [Phyllotreta striolata]
MRPIPVVALLFQFVLHHLPDLGDAARILAVIPSASRSHHVPFQPLWRTLASRGHRLTVITTDPVRDPAASNLTEVDISHCYRIYDEHRVTELFVDETKSFGEIAAVLRVTFEECHDYILSLEEVQRFIHDDSVEFDLVMVEAQLPTMLAFAWRFRCPSIGIASLEPAMQIHDSLGNLVHPVVNPDPNLNIEDDARMGFWDRLKSAAYVMVYKLFVYNRSYPNYHAQMKRYFGNDLPDLRELQDNISMLFVGTHPLFHNMKLSNLNTISVGGGMHISPPKALPLDLQKFLDEAERGVIYFSLGSNVKANLLTESFKKAITGAFAEIPYKVLLKMDDVLVDASENVLVRKWMPQQDILRHKNVKLFITQGGLQSLQESVVNGIPLIGIPFFGDQITNVNKMVKKGYGLKINRRTITKDILVSAIKEVMDNPKYRETAELMGEIFRDEEIPSLQRAVYWTEYVIRHKGAKHLRSPSLGMPAWKFYMLDVLGFLFVTCLLVLMVFYYCVKMFCRLVRRLCCNGGRPRSNRSKIKRN